MCEGASECGIKTLHKHQETHMLRTRSSSFLTQVAASLSSSMAWTLRPEHNSSNNMIVCNKDRPRMRRVSMQVRERPQSNIDVVVDIMIGEVSL